MARRRSRKQRVVLRGKQRVVLHRRMTSSIVAVSVVAAILLGGRAVSRSVLAPGFIQRHTPVIEVKAPETLADLPLLKQAPPGTFFLWIPGAEWRLRKQWMQQYPAVGDVQFEKHYLNNRIVAGLQPRIPLVRLDNRGLDKDGMIFTLASKSWTPVPKAILPATRSLPVLGRWLSEVSRNTGFWNQVVAVSQDPRGDMWLDMQTGTRVAWGLPESKNAREKMRCLTMVLDDAHKRLGGAAAADVRFFDEGRVIVRPKLAT